MAEFYHFDSLFHKKNSYVTELVFLKVVIMSSVFFFKKICKKAIFRFLPENVVLLFTLLDELPISEPNVCFGYFYNQLSS